MTRVGVGRAAMSAAWFMITAAGLVIAHHADAEMTRAWQPADVNAALGRLKEAETRGDDATAAPETRAAARREADQLRARLLELSPSDDRAPTWLVDRAAFTLSLLGADDADVSVLVGLPTVEQRRRVMQAAQNALAYLENAERAATARVAALEGRVVAGGSGAAGAEEAIGRLVDVEQSQRIPFFSGVARTLMAGAAAADVDRATAAAAAIKSLENLRLKTPAMEAARDALAALAVFNASNTVTERARGVMQNKLTGAMKHPSAEPATRRRARLGLLALGTPATGVSEATRSWSDQLLECEAILRRETMSIAGSAPRPLSTVIPGGPVAEMLRLSRENDGTPEQRDARRALVYAKIAPHVDARAGASVAAELVFARAVAMLRDQGEGVSASAGAQSEALLRSVGDRDDAPMDVRADALWELSALLERKGQPTSKQIEPLDRIVRELSGSARAVAAARMVAERASPERIAAGGGGDGQSNTLRPEYLSAVRLLAAKTGEPRWAIELVRSQLSTASGQVTPESLRAAMDAYAALPDNPGKTKAALSIADALSQLGPKLRTTPPDVRARMMSEALEFVRQSAPSKADGLTLDFAQAHLEAGDEQALLLFSLARGSSVDVMGSANAGKIRLGLAAAQRKARRVDDAFSTLRELAEQFEKPPGEIGREEPYWAAWCALLELFVAEDAARERQGELKAHLARLALVDPALGGPVFAGRFAAIRAGLEAGTPAPAPTPAP